MKDVDSSQAPAAIADKALAVRFSLGATQCVVREFHLHVTPSCQGMSNQPWSMKFQSQALFSISFPFHNENSKHIGQWDMILTHAGLPSHLYDLCPGPPAWG